MKRLIPALLLLAVFGSYFLFKSAPQNYSDQPEIDGHRQPARNVEGSTPEIPIRENKPSRSNDPPLLATERLDGEQVEQHIAALMDASAKSDPNSLALITNSLQHPNPEIRKAALEATIQFGNRDAIPLLRDLAAKTLDAREKIELQEAAEFLELPSLSEIRRSRRANPPKP